MKKDIEGKAIRPLASAEEAVGDGEMPRAGYGKKLGQALYDAVENRR
jgi:hypothetical protein